MHTGSCLCGAVRYEVSGAFSKIAYCHCRECRKATGSSFATNASVAAKDFRFVAGEDRLGRFESSPGQFRCFCTGCGSPVVKLYADVPEVRVRLGTLDQPLATDVEAHFFANEKADWYEIRDDLPRYPA